MLRVIDFNVPSVFTSSNFESIVKLFYEESRSKILFQNQEGVIQNHNDILESTD